MEVLIIYDNTTLYAVLAGETLASAAGHIASGYPDLLAGWVAGTVRVALVDLPTDGSFAYFSATGSDLPPVVTGSQTIPDDCADLAAVPVATGGIILSWSGVKPADLLEYLVRWSPLTAGAAWHTSSVVWRSASPFVHLPAALPGTYSVKAVTRTGGESVNAAEVVVAEVPSDLVPLDLYASYSEAPAWGGTLANFTAVSGELQATDPALPAEYVASHEVDFGIVRTARVTASVLWSAIANSGLVDVIADIDAVEAWDGFITDCNVQAFIYTSQDGSTPTKKQPLFAGDYTFRRARFTLEATAHNPLSDVFRGKAVIDSSEAGVGSRTVVELLQTDYNRITVQTFDITVKTFQTIATI